MRRPAASEGLPSGEPLSPSSPGQGRQPDKVHALVSAALERLEEGLRLGRSEELQQYLRVLARFHRYSLHNCLLIASQFSGATRVAGFQTWKKLGRWVRKGERGIAIIVPVTLRRREADGEDDETVVRFRTGYVFDVSQTEGEPLPEPSSANGDPGHHLANLHEFTRERGIAVEPSDALAPGTDGLSTGGRIVLRAGLGPAEELHVLAHEIAHELLHKGDSGTRPSKTVRETEAEAVAFVICEATGLATGRSSTDYISLYEGDEETLRGSLARIQAVASSVLGALLPGQQVESE